MEWARIRGNRQATVGFLLGIGVMTVLGFTAATAGVGLGWVQSHVRLVGAPHFVTSFIGSLLATGLLWTLLWGRGLLPTFSDRSLRRYPCNARQRLIARALVVAVDPIWICLGSAFAAYLGTASLYGAVEWQAALASLALFMPLCWFSTLALLALVESGFSTIRGALLSVSLAAALYALHWLLGTPWEDVSAIVSSSGFQGVPAIVRALIWLFTLGAAIAAAGWLKQGEKSGGRLVWRLYRLLVTAGRAPEAAAANAKSLVYHLRSVRVRWAAAVSMFIYPGIVRFDAKHLPNGPAGSVYLAFAVLFCAGALIPRNLLLNQFGYDGTGLSRYTLAPVKLSAVAIWSTQASLQIGSTYLVLAWLIFCGLGYFHSWLLALSGLGFGVAGMLLYACIGTVTSIWTRHDADYNVVAGNDMSVGAIAGLGIPAVCAFSLAVKLAGVMPLSGLGLRSTLAALLSCAATYVLWVVTQHLVMANDAKVRSRVLGG